MLMTALGIKKIKGAYWVKVDSALKGIEADSKAAQFRSEGKKIMVFKTFSGYDLYARILEC